VQLHARLQARSFGGLPTLHLGDYELVVADKACTTIMNFDQD